MVERLIAMGGAVGHVPYGGFVSSVTPVDGDLFRIMATELLDEVGVTILYGAQVVGAEREGGEVTLVRAAIKGGIAELRAPAIVDSSGDADVAAFAGAGFRMGQEGTGKMQPVSMLLQFHRVDTRAIAEALAEVPPAMASRADHPDPFPVYFNGHLGRWNAENRKEGVFPNDDHKIFCNTVWPHRVNVNTSAVFGFDGSDARSYSRATIELTRQCARIGEFLKAHVPGFAGCYYIPAAFAGVRQTRAIEGLYQINEADIRAGRKFPDAVGQGCFPMDIHDPDTGQVSFADIGGDGAYDLPYRALVPKGFDNLIVAGRCISATHFAHGATRNMAPCLVTGQAAGAAAALVAQQGIPFAKLDVSALQSMLAAAGASLSELKAVLAR
jgi:hypothetical protein